MKAARDNSHFSDKETGSVCPIFCTKRPVQVFHFSGKEDDNCTTDKTLKSKLSEGSMLSVHLFPNSGHTHETAAGANKGNEKIDRASGEDPPVKKIFGTGFTTGNEMLEELTHLSVLKEHNTHSPAAKEPICVDHTTEKQGIQQPKYQNYAANRKSILGEKRC